MSITTRTALSLPYFAPPSCRPFEGRAEGREALRGSRLRFLWAVCDQRLPHSGLKTSRLTDFEHGGLCWQTELSAGDVSEQKVPFQSGDKGKTRERCAYHGYHIIGSLREGEPKSTSDWSNGDVQGDLVSRLGACIRHPSPSYFQ